MSADPVAPVTEATSVPAQETPAKDQEIGHKVYVGNLAADTTEEGLRAFFAPVASDIVNVQVIHGTRGNHYGFVAVSTQAAAEKAVAELHQKSIGDQAITVELARPAEGKRPRNFKGRRFGRRRGKAPPGEVSEAEANGEGAAKDAPTTDGEGKADATKSKKAKKPRKKKTKAATPNGEANAEGKPAAPATENGDSAPAEKAEKKAKPKREKKPRTPRAEGEDPAGEQSKTVLFVANLAYSIDDAALSEIFTSEGINVVSARVVCRPWGNPRRSKGFGFVDVGSEEEQKKALEKTANKEIAGRAIAVKIAVNAQKELESADGGVAAEVKRESTPEVAVLAS
jgi:RNA recognition motif-containing protein